MGGVAAGGGAPGGGDDGGSVGRRAAAAGPDGVLVWDPATGREVRRLRPDHGGVAALAFTADGRRLASAGADGTVLLWDVPAGP
jgi:WD40 repeat protein